MLLHASDFLATSVVQAREAASKMEEARNSPPNALALMREADALLLNALAENALAAHLVATRSVTMHSEQSDAILSALKQQLGAKLDTWFSTRSGY